LKTLKEPENKDILQLHEARIKDLQDQLKEKDEQLKAQVIHIQAMFNQKFIEAPGAKKTMVAILVISATIMPPDKN
jgi:hypothetical protein